MRASIIALLTLFCSSAAFSQGHVVYNTDTNQMTMTGLAGLVSGLGSFLGSNSYQTRVPGLSPDQRHHQTWGELQSQLNPSREMLESVKRFNEGRHETENPYRLTEEERKWIYNDPEVIKNYMPKEIRELEKIPDPPEYELPKFESPEGEFRDEIIRQYKDLYKVNPQYGKGQTAREIGLSATQSADHSYSQGAEADAQFYKELGKGMLDIAVGLDPVTGLGRSTFELFTGRNLITGGRLSNFDRGFAFLGVMSGGGLTSIKNTVRLLGQVPKLAREMQTIKAASLETKKILRPVVDFLKRNGVNDRDRRREVITAFTRESKVVKLPEDREVVRLFVQGETRPRSYWVTELPVKNPEEMLALPKPGIYELKRWTIPAGTEVLEGGVAPNFGHLGGGRQIYIPRPEVLK